MNNATLAPQNSVALMIMQHKQRQILVTSALPYANGPIHIGHMVEYIQTDIWVRFHKMRGHQCFYVCADDAHGTPIMLRAEEKNISPETLISEMQQEHQNDFNDFVINFDNYHTTHSSENQIFANTIYEKLDNDGHISKKTIKQFYDYRFTALSIEDNEYQDRNMHEVINPIQYSFFSLKILSIFPSLLLQMSGKLINIDTVAPKTASLSIWSIISDDFISLLACKFSG